MQINLRNLLSLGLILGIPVSPIFWAESATATTFQLTPLDLGNGLTVSGTVTTNGKRGRLTAPDFTHWNIAVTSFTEIAQYTKTTSPFPTVSQVSATSDGKIAVATPPDNASEGGALTFRGGTYFNVQVADFTAPFLPGGQAGYVANRGNFSFLPLNQPNGIDYLVAQDCFPTPGGMRFNLLPVDLGNGLLMTGTITTDNTVGLLSATNLLDWNIHVVSSTTDIFTETNSFVLASDRVFTDGQSIAVVNPGGNWAFGLPGVPGRVDPTKVQLADFTDPTFPGGQAYYLTPFGYQGVLTPLSFKVKYVAATKLNAGANATATVPEPSLILGLLAIGILGIGTRLSPHRQ